MLADSTAQQQNQIEGENRENRVKLLHTAAHNHRPEGFSSPFYALWSLTELVSNAPPESYSEGKKKERNYRKKGCGLAGQILCRSRVFLFTLLYVQHAVCTAAKSDCSFLQYQDFSSRVQLFSSLNKNLVSILNPSFSLRNSARVRETFWSEAIYKIKMVFERVPGEEDPALPGWRQSIFQV